jgi:ribosomal protein L11 methyltransferase
MDKPYYEMEIAFNEGTYNAIYNRLYLNDITTILEEAGVLKIYFPESDLSVTETIKDDLINLDGVNSTDINITKYDNHDWNKEWEKTIEPIYIKDKLIIYPSWKKDTLGNTEGKILIEIDPKMSFGTGHNETTQLILEMMYDYIDSTDKYMFDFGCGTGILAIAGIKLGVKEAVAIDIDDDSIENAEEYIAGNDAADSILLYKADIAEISETNFDIVAANITSGVIIPNLQSIYNKLKPDGKLFITGILNEEAEELINSLTANNFLIKELRSKAEWSGFYCIKK